MGLPETTSDMRPCTPGGTRIALRSRIEAARLTDQVTAVCVRGVCWYTSFTRTRVQNVTLSEDLHRLSSQIRVQTRMQERAEDEHTALTKKHAELEAALRSTQRQIELLDQV
jgi:C4-dicarboxylate-specific signal transduction histidine kinase